MALNKGEWSEVYVFLKLLADGVLYAADADLNKIASIYYPILKIIRDDVNRDYERTSADIKIIDSKTDAVLASMSIDDFVSMSEGLLLNIRNDSGTFESEITESFMNGLGIERLKAKSVDKRDITIKVHDSFTGFDPVLGFSIKSNLGSASTLLNASGSTNFVYTVNGVSLDADDISIINAIETRSKIRDRITEIKNRGGTLVFDSVDSPIFESNLKMIDSEMPKIISELLLIHYRGITSNLSEAVAELERMNPCGYDMSTGHPFYSYKIKNFITDIALGMMPNSVWSGRYDATGGFIVVKEDGDVLCYHIYNRNEFQDYLFKNTKFETPSSSRHGFGTIETDSLGSLMFKLNLQIRFI